MTHPGAPLGCPAQLRGVLLLWLFASSVGAAACSRDEETQAIRPDVVPTSVAPSPAAPSPAGSSFSTTPLTFRGIASCEAYWGAVEACGERVLESKRDPIEKLAARRSLFEAERQLREGWKSFRGDELAALCSAGNAALDRDPSCAAPAAR
ncbi:MAG: hypothetical protein U0271_14740 [Polyangiaceae bacterium]